MEQNPLCIAFASQKGGVGKSTLTVLAASWLHYLHGIRVAVVDCDYPQHSILKLSNRDKAVVQSSAIHTPLRIHILLSADTDVSCYIQTTASMQTSTSVSA